MKSDLYSVPAPAGGAVSILGGHVGYAARAMCFVEDGSVIVVLTNRDDVGTEVADALATAARSG
jgi:hypothetical protein